MDAYIAKAKYAREHGLPEPAMPDPWVLDQTDSSNAASPTPQPGEALGHPIPNQTTNSGGTRSFQQKNGFGEPVSGR